MVTQPKSALRRHIRSCPFKGPRRRIFGSGPRGPKLKKPILNQFGAPGALPNRCALKFHATYTYFHIFWWHGMNILIFWKVRQHLLEGSWIEINLITNLRTMPRPPGHLFEAGGLIFWPRGYFGDRGAQKIRSGEKF